MIHDQLDSPTTRWLQQQSPVFQTAFAWLHALPANPPEGITELRGQEFYVNVHSYDTKPADQCRWESHRRTIDLQYCIAGGEIIEWTPAGTLAPLGDYNETKEAEHWQPGGPPPARLSMSPGSFVIFLPNELHRPKVADGTHPRINKLVFKIAASLWT